jgi:hypothetical protein
MLLTPRETRKMLERLHDTVFDTYQKTEQQPLTFELNRIFMAANTAIDRNNQSEMYRVLRCYLIIIEGHLLLAQQQSIVSVVQQVKSLLKAEKHVSAVQ